MNNTGNLAELHPRSTAHVENFQKDITAAMLALAACSEKPGGDAASKAFAAEAAPKIAMHLDMANKLDVAAVEHIGRDTAAPAANAQ